MTIISIQKTETSLSLARLSLLDPKRVGAYIKQAWRGGETILVQRVPDGLELPIGWLFISILGHAIFRIPAQPALYPFCAFDESWPGVIFPDGGKQPVAQRSDEDICKQLWEQLSGQEIRVQLTTSHYLREIPLQGGSTPKHGDLYRRLTTGDGRVVWLDKQFTDALSKDPDDLDDYLYEELKDGTIRIAAANGYVAFVRPSTEVVEHTEPLPETTRYDGELNLKAVRHYFEGLTSPSSYDRAVAWVQNIGSTEAPIYLLSDKKLIVCVVGRPPDLGPYTVFSAGWNIAVFDEKNPIARQKSEWDHMNPLTYWSTFHEQAAEMPLIQLVLTSDLYESGGKRRGESGTFCRIFHRLNEAGQVRRVFLNRDMTDMLSPDMSELASEFCFETAHGDVKPVRVLHHVGTSLLPVALLMPMDLRNELWREPKEGGEN